MKKRKVLGIFCLFLLFPTMILATENKEDTQAVRELMRYLLIDVHPDSLTMQKVGRSFSFGDWEHWRERKIPLVYADEYDTGLYETPNWDVTLHYWGLRKEELNGTMEKVLSQQKPFLKGVQNIFFVNASVPNVCLLNVRFCSDWTAGWYVPGDSFQDYTDAPKKLLGTFIGIRVSPHLFVKYATVPYALTHEIGHNVWFRYLTDAEREQWWQYYQESEKEYFLNNDVWDDNDSYVTKYGSMNVEEDFAESWAQWHYYRNKNIDKRRLAIIKTVVLRNS